MNDGELIILHNKILDLVEYFDKFCKENNITYYLMGGTALGAMRHQGFIPWDDDFDVFMDYKNYQNFLKIVNDELDKDKYYFQKEDTKEWSMFFSKVRMNNTTFIEKNLMGKDMHHGIYIDIMCLNNTSSNRYIRYLHYLSARILNARALIGNNYITDNKIKKIALFVSKIIVVRFVKNNLLSFVRSFNNKQTLMIGHFFGRAPFLKTSFYTSYLGKQRYVKFEHLSLPVPQHVEEYLKVRYGEEYMELPSEEEKIKYPSHAHIVDVKKSYKEYMQ